MLRNHGELLPQLIAEALRKMGNFCAPSFLMQQGMLHPHRRHLSRTVPVELTRSELTGAFEKGERTYASQVFPAMLVLFRRRRRGLAIARRAPCLLTYRPGDVARNMAIFHLSIRPISRAKGHSAVAQIAYDALQIEQQPHWPKSTTGPSTSRM